MTYALTINQEHKIYRDDISVVFFFLLSELQAEYIEIVKHKKVYEKLDDREIIINEHYHCLVQCNIDLNEMIQKKLFHVEKVKNVKAYQKYMHSHDKIEAYEYGSLSYSEPIDDNDIIEYALKYGAQKTVLKYGFKALKVYKTLKEFLNDYDIEMKGGDYK